MISIDQISEDAYQDKGDGVSGAEDFQADEDRGRVRVLVALPNTAA